MDDNPRRRNMVGFCAIWVMAMASTPVIAFQSYLDSISNLNPTPNGNSDSTGLTFGTPPPPMPPPPEVERIDEFSNSNLPEPQEEFYSSGPTQWQSVSPSHPWPVSPGVTGGTNGSSGDNESFTTDAATTGSINGGNNKHVNDPSSSYVSSQYLDYLQETEKATQRMNGSTDTKEMQLPTSSLVPNPIEPQQRFAESAEDIALETSSLPEPMNQLEAFIEKKKEGIDIPLETSSLPEPVNQLDAFIEKKTEGIDIPLETSSLDEPINQLDAFIEKKKEGIDIPLEASSLDEPMNQLDAFIEKKKEGVDAAFSDYGRLLKKHMRLALTGGVPLNQEMAGERHAPNIDTTGMTERIMRSIQAEGQARGAGGASTWEAFEMAEASWARLKEYIPSVDDAPPEPFVTEEGGMGNPKCFAKLLYQKPRSLDFDVTVCGVTVGIFFATALQLQGYNVCVVEAGKLLGREQEWNISMDELLRLINLGVLSKEDIDAAIQTDFAGCRSGFKNKEVEVKGGYLDNGVGYECFTDDVMNLGLSPKILLERTVQRFESLGGVIKEHLPLKGVCVVKEIGAALDFGADEEPITAHLVIDAMGTDSPITQQQRYGRKPDGICAVVGTCASGFDPTTNLNGDIIYSNTAIQDKGREGGRMQYFWEAFPVGIGRNGKAPGTSDTKTTYMFTYMDAHQRRPTLESIMEDYWRLLPQYQPSIKNPELDLDFKRVLFEYFPIYRELPLQPQFNRILAVGDASGIQSPLSFGGFGALTRHLERITVAVTEALDGNLLKKEDLAKINPYTPNLSATWIFQKVRTNP